MHDKEVHQGSRDLAAIPVAVKGFLNLSTIGSFTEEEAVEFHVVPFGVNAQSVCLEVTLKQLRVVCTMTYVGAGLDELAFKEEFIVKRDSPKEQLKTPFKEVHSDEEPLLQLYLFKSPALT